MNEGYIYRDHVTDKKITHPNTVLEFYTKHHHHSSREQWHQIIQHGQVKIDKKIVNDVNFALSPGQTLEYLRAPWVEPDVIMEFDVIFQDEHILVINKPEGLPVLPGAMFLNNTLLNLAKRKLNDKRLRPIHRLGRGTTGAILFAKL
eukprot:TRINITY_DN2130_c0_g1_i2.p1 TRINITY_DN2130_c0_g1~~TRINITY_DN2130_c0_g1_i2.p1  ORF type:complete len:147 (-),score=22.84 TRINITY_DN2130_c0_g1_i2:591-1031(-)